VVNSFALGGKTAIVTGAANGIGRAIAVAFAQAGAAVACLDLDQRQASATAAAIEAAGGHALSLSGDVSREADTLGAAAAARDAVGRIEVLVNAAAADDPSGTVLDIDPVDWDRVFAVNVKGYYLMSRAVRPIMIAAGGGSIIHTASQLGRVAAPARAVYLQPRAPPSLPRRWRPITLDRRSG